MDTIKLKNTDTRAPKDFDKAKTKEKTEEILEELDGLQNLLYAESKHSVLIILQGMDGSGKDGLIRKVLGNMNPQGVMVTSYKVPTEEELSHDFLWRIHKKTPAKGMIQVFNRSHGYSNTVRMLGIPDRLVEHGTPKELHHECGFDAPSIAETVRDMMKDRIRVTHSILQ